MTMLDLHADAAHLTASLVDIESVSGNELALADQIHAALSGHDHLELLRSGNTIMARTTQGHETRVLLGGHIDTVPVADNLPSMRAADLIYGCGTCDMKASIAVMLKLAVAVTRPRVDVTYVFYDCEEIEADRNGLTRVESEHRDWLDADLAILMEPTDGEVEAGCQGTMRAVITTHGHRAHSARSWLGKNAIHAAGEVLRRLEDYVPRDVEIDGCTYKEGLNAVYVSGGVAGNVIPDSCTVSVNFRFAPDRSIAQAEAHIREVFAGFDVAISDSAGAAMPGLGTPAAQAFVSAVGSPPRAKYGWTDVSRFSALGIPALNYGPGDPNLAHTREESVSITKIEQAEAVMRRFLTA